MSPHGSTTNVGTMLFSIPCPSFFSCSYSLASPTADSIEENSAVQCVHAMLNPVSGLIWARDSK